MAGNGFPTIETVDLRRDMATGRQRRTMARAPSCAGASSRCCCRLSSGTTGMPKGPMVTHGHTLEPALHLHDQPDLQRGRPFHHGDAALFRRRALHDDGVSVHGRDRRPFSGALRSRKSSPGRSTRSGSRRCSWCRHCCGGCWRCRKASLPLFARRAPADLVGIEPLSGGAAPDHARAVSALLQFLQLVRGRRHFAAAARASRRGVAVGRQGRVRRRGPDHRRAASAGASPGRSAQSAIAAAALPTATIAIPRRARPRSATAGIIRAISAASTRTAFSTSPVAPRT